MGDECDYHSSLVQRIFKRTHLYAKQPASMRFSSTVEFCDYIHMSDAEKGAKRYRLFSPRSPCSLRYPKERYFQLNLIPLARYGTIEFRAHSATHNTERVTRWVQFLTAFVEYFGRGAGKHEMDTFLQGTTHEDYIKLQEAQKTATVDDLFSKLSDELDTGSKAFFLSRR